MAVQAHPPARTPALRAYQVRVARALLVGIVERRSRSFTVMFPRQAGKNEVSAAVVAALLRIHANRGGSISVCAPTLTPQAATNEWVFMQTIKDVSLATKTGHKMKVRPGRKVLEQA